MRVVSLASGSNGNAYAVEDGGEILLIDCGLSCLELRKRCDAAAVALDRLVGVLFTHSHDDHIKGVSAFHRKFPAVPLFANLMTAETISAQTAVPEADFIPFENGQEFAVGSFAVGAFSIPHDTSDPVGYLVKTPTGRTYFHGTDIGTPLDSIGVKLASAEVAVLESNHDPVLLFGSGRPPSVIQRIAGPRGHLSNDDSAGLVRRFASPCLRKLALAHLSRDCNSPHLAEGTMRRALAEAKRTDVELKTLSQDEVVVV